MNRNGSAAFPNFGRGFTLPLAAERISLSLCLSVRVSHRKKLSFNHLIFTATGFNFLKKICILSKLDEPTVLIQVTFSDCRTGCQVQKTAIILSSKWSNQDLKGRFWFLRTRKMKKSFPLMKQVLMPI